MTRRLIAVSFFAAMFTAVTWLLLATACSHLPANVKATVESITWTTNEGSAGE